ncbi:MAG: DUF5518 domain-containing protein [Salinirussus sp.]
MAERETWINALIGAIVGIILSPLPLSTVLGGGVAGYLEAGSRSEGIRVGALAGIVMFVPMVLLLFLVGNVFLIGMMGGMMGPGHLFNLAGGLTAIALTFTLVFGFVYTVCLAILGGFLGNYIKHETDIGG